MHFSEKALPISIPYLSVYSCEQKPKGWAQPLPGPPACACARVRLAPENPIPVFKEADSLEACLDLAPLSGEPSCREGLHPFNSEARLKESDIFSYRSCAVLSTHFA